MKSVLTPRTLFILALIAIVSAMAVLVTACGDDDDDDGGSPTAEATTAAATEGATPTEAPTATPEPETLRYGITGSVAVFLYAWVGDQEGIFADHGINIDIITPQSGSGIDVVQLLAAGEVDIAGTIADGAILAVEEGDADFSVVNVPMSPFQWALIGRKDLTSIQDLKGGTIGVSSLTSGPTLATIRLLEANGLTSDDYELSVVGGTSARVAALDAGSIDAGPISQPQQFLLVDEGYSDLGSTATDTPFYPGAVDIVSNDFIADNCGLLTRYLEAIADIADWINDPANHDAAVQIIVDEAGGDPSQAEQTLDLYLESDVFHLEEPTDVMDQVRGIMIDAGIIDDTAVTADEISNTDCFPS